MLGFTLQALGARRIEKLPGRGSNILIDHEQLDAAGNERVR